MEYIVMPGLPGKIYVPQKPAESTKKHDCPDCFSCRMCGNARCGVCRAKKRACSDNCIKQETSIEKQG